MYIGMGFEISLLLAICMIFVMFFFFSLHSNSQLDINIKGGMIKDLLNLAGFMIPNKSDLTGAYSAPEPGWVTVTFHTSA